MTCWLRSLSTQHKLGVIAEEKTSIEKCLHQMGLWASLWGTFFVDDWCGRAQLAVGGAIPEQVVLGSIRKQAEQAM